MRKSFTWNYEKKEIEARVIQMLERSIISDDVIEVFGRLGMKLPEISLLLEEYLNEVRQLKRKTLHWKC
jgi:type I restriction enzyme, R subunit